MFRLTKAEFVKVLKMPSIYIMGIILVITIIVSAFVFNPNSNRDVSLSLGTNSSIDSYNLFYSNSGSENKISYDSNVANANDIINFYQSKNIKYNNLVSKYESIRTNYDYLMEIYNVHLTYQVSDALSNLINSVEEFMAEYKNLSYLNESAYKAFIQNNSQFLTSLDTSVSDFISYANDNLSYPNLIINYYNSYSLNTKLQASCENIKNFTKYIIQLEFNKLNSTYRLYKEIAFGLNPSQANSAKNNVKTALNNLKDFFNLVSETDYPIILITINQKVEFVEEIEMLNQNLNSITSNNKEIITLIEELNVFDKLKHISDEIKDINLNNTTLSNILNLQLNMPVNLQVKLDYINEIKDNSSNDEMLGAILSYKKTTQNMYNLTLNTLLHASVKGQSTGYISNLYGTYFNDYNDYKIKEIIAVNEFLIENNLTDESFQFPFSFNENSYSSTSAYDFIFFTMRICTIIIIIFGMLLIGNLITQEEERGTIRLLLIRPFRRGRIASSKLLASLFFCMCFLAFTFIISFVAGSLIYGINTLPVLVIFNATNVFQLSGFVLLLINLLLTIIEILFFLLIGFLCAILFRNYAGALTSSLLILLITFTLNALLSGSILLTFIPFSHAYLFKYFGNEFVYGNNYNVLKNIFCSPISTNMSFILSSIVVLITLIVLYILSLNIYKKRDF